MLWLLYIAFLVAFDSESLKVNTQKKQSRMCEIRMNLIIFSAKMKIIWSELMRSSLTLLLLLFCLFFCEWREHREIGYEYVTLLDTRKRKKSMEPNHLGIQTDPYSSVCSFVFSTLPKACSVFVCCCFSFGMIAETLFQCKFLLFFYWFPYCAQSGSQYVFSLRFNFWILWLRNCRVCRFQFSLRVLTATHAE